MKGFNVSVAGLAQMLGLASCPKCHSSTNCKIAHFLFSTSKYQWCIFVAFVFKAMGLCRQSAAETNSAQAQHWKTISIKLLTQIGFLFAHACHDSHTDDFDWVGHGEFHHIYTTEMPSSTTSEFHYQLLPIT